MSPTRRRYISSAESPRAAALPAVGAAPDGAGCAATATQPSANAAAIAAGMPREASRNNGNAAMVDFLRLAGPAARATGRC